MSRMEYPIISNNQREAIESTVTDTGGADDTAFAKFMEKQIPPLILMAKSRNYDFLAYLLSMALMELKTLSAASPGECSKT